MPLTATSGRPLKCCPTWGRAPRSSACCWTPGCAARTPPGRASTRKSGAGGTARARRTRRRTASPPTARSWTVPAPGENWRLTFFGGERGLGDLAQMRLGEHALHTWDVAVARDDKATVAEDAVELIVDTLPVLASMIGKPASEPLRVHVTTYDPERRFQLDAGPDGVSLSPAAPSPLPPGGAELRLPAEAFVRLVYGRLDDEHPAPAETAHVELGTLRGIFPGF